MAEVVQAEVKPSVQFMQFETVSVSRMDAIQQVCRDLAG